MRFWKNSLILFGLSIVLLSPLQVYANHSKIGFLVKRQLHEEAKTIYDWSRLQGYHCEVLNPWPQGQFKVLGNDLWADISDYPVLWLDSRPNPNGAGRLVDYINDVWLEPECKKAIIDYVKNGGILIVSSGAMHYPVELGVESVRPNRPVFWSGGKTSIKNYTSSELLGQSSEINSVFDGTGNFTFVRYVRGAKPQNGRVLAVHSQSENIIEMVRWDVGIGKIYGFSFTPWMSSQNGSLDSIGKILKTLFFDIAKIKPDEKLTKQIKKLLEIERKQKQQAKIDAMKFTEVYREASPEKAGIERPAVILKEDGFVIGNSKLERHINFKPVLKTICVWNKAANEIVPTGSSEFRITFGKEAESKNLGSDDFEMDGVPAITNQEGQSSITLSLIHKKSLLAVKLTYTVTDEPYIEKKMEITNNSGQELFLREVWLDGLRFNDSINVVAYKIFSVFARGDKGSIWMCQQLPYSCPSADETANYIAVGYPPCESFANGAVYKSEASYMSVVKLSGQMSRPWGHKHQFSSYGEWGDPVRSLDEAEIESCVDFIDKKCENTRMKEAYVLYHAYHDYHTTGLTNFLPYRKAGQPSPGSGVESIKDWIRLSGKYGVKTYCLYPESNAWVDHEPAYKMMEEQINPYLDSMGMDTQIWFSSYSAGWYGRPAWFAGHVWKNYRDKELQDFWVDKFLPLLKKFRGKAVWADQGGAFIDKDYDQSLGFPGKLPMSPHIYKEFKGWQRIVSKLREQVPDLIWGGAHLGNAQAPLFCNINNLYYWCEGTHHYKPDLDRHPATSWPKAMADAYRKEQYWALKERFVPYRFSQGNINYQCHSSRYVEQTGEPITQHFRYLMLQNLAMHPTIALWGLQSLTDLGIFGEREIEISNKWINFAKTNAQSLYNRPYIPVGEPGYGKVEIYSYGDRGNGWVFLVNPHFLNTDCKFKIGDETGFTNSDQYAVREISPNKRWRMFNDKPAVRPGETISFNIPGYTVVVLQIEPVKRAWLGCKEITAGVEMSYENNFIVNKGEWITWATFDVNDPQNSILKEKGYGIVPGTASRIFIKEWFTLPDSQECDLSKGFRRGKQVKFEQTQIIKDKFTLADFAGLAMSDLKKDPVYDRVIISKKQLKNRKEKDEKIISIQDHKAEEKAYWLSAEVKLDKLPVEPVLYLQMKTPERATAKVWLNGILQDCKQSINDWCVLKPQGLKVGNNTIVIWLSPQ